jgi:serine protease inhibitor
MRLARRWFASLDSRRAKAFDPAMTRKAMFHREGMTDVQVEMMSTPKTQLRTAFVGDARWVELPYRGGDISLLAYTETRFGTNATQPPLDDLEARLDDLDFAEVVSMLGESEQILQMPRFSLRSRVDLIPIFKSLGVLDLFDPSLADLTKIDAGGDRFVDPFLHEATVEVDEQGTVAAAATAAGASVSSPCRRFVIHRTNPTAI